MTGLVKGARMPFGRQLGEVIQYAYVVEDVDASIAIYSSGSASGPGSSAVRSRLPKRFIWGRTPG